MAKQKKSQEVKFPAWLTWLYALSSFLFIPFFYYKPVVDPTLVPKFMALAILMLFYVLVFLVFRKLQMQVGVLFRSWPVWFWTGFIILSVISLFAAINPLEGWFDILRLTLSLLYLVITAAILFRTNNIRPFIISAILLTLAFATIGYYQYFTHAFRQTDFSMMYKVNGLMSHKNVFSGILYLVIPILGYALLTSVKGLRIITGMAMFLSISLLMIIQTRSIWLALFVFMLISAVLGFIFRQDIKLKHNLELRRSLFLGVGILLAAFIFAFLVSSFSTRNPLRTAPPRTLEKTDNLGKRAASIFSTSSPTRIKRLDIWEQTLNMVAEHPVLGVGAGNWKICVPDYYQPNPDESYYHNWRRPHNDYIWVLVEKGVPGLLLYLGFFITVLITSLGVLRKSIQPGQKILVIMMMAGLAGYCVDASFSFPYERVDIQMFMMFFVSVILWIQLTVSGREIKPLRTTGKWFLLVAAIFLVFGLHTARKMIKAETYTNYAYAAQMSGQWRTVILAIDLGYSQWAPLDQTNKPLLWFRGNANMRLGMERIDSLMQTGTSQVDSSMRQVIFGEARRDLEHALEQNPWSVPVLHDLATVHYMQEDYPGAVKLFQEALRIYPLFRSSLKILGMTYYAMGEYEEAVNCYYRCLTDQPNPEIDTLIQAVALKLYPPESQE